MKSTEVYFEDRRSPQEIQCQLERTLMTLLEATAGEQLRYAGTLRMGDVTYDVRLCFEAAMAEANAYTLRMEATWPDPRWESSAVTWLDHWMRGFAPADRATSGTNSPERYQALAQAALRAEAHLTDVAAVQRAIVEAMRRGGTYGTAHKEGGTNIRFRAGVFVRADYGESERVEQFTTEEAFLKFLRRFFDYEVSRHCEPAKPAEYVAWKLLFRLLH